MKDQKVNSVDHDNSVLKFIMRNYGILFFLILFVLVASIFNPVMISIQNLRTISFQIVPIALIAIGQLFVMISGGVDLSTGFGVALVSIIMGVVWDKTHNIALSSLVCIVVGLLIGLINGILVSKFKLLPIVVTLGTMTIFQGLTLLIQEKYNHVIFLKHQFFSFWGSGSIFRIPSSFIFLVVFLIIGFFILHNLKYGVHLIAVGGNTFNASLAGINVGRVKLIAYLFSGLCVGLSGFILTSQLMLVHAITTTAMSLTLFSIAGIIIGGVRLEGGKGTIQGAFIGVLFIAFITNMLNILNIDQIWQQTIQGLIIIAALSFERILYSRMGTVE